MDLDKIETIFFDVLEDIRDYLPDLTLVGGWLPYIYSNFLWQNFVRNPVTTVDIDFGVGQFITGEYPKTIFEAFSSLGYKEHHLKMGRAFPVVLYKEKIPVEFITYPGADIKMIQKVIGEQIAINKVDQFDFLLRHRIPIKIHAKSKVHLIYCPKPSAFLCHKGATFIDRESQEKQAKDLYYMYFVLRYAPDIDLILTEISQYREKELLGDVSDNIARFFERVSSRGCLWVERENGPDEYIHDLRQDIYNRFKSLSEAIKRMDE